MRSVLIRSGVSKDVAIFAAVVALAVQATSARGQHSAYIAKECGANPCPGSPLVCQILAGNNDSFGDTIEVLEAWDVVDPKGAEIRVPAAGNLPIAYVYGNTDCVVGGSLPCKLCAPGSTACGMNVPDPGEYGAVEFLAFDYIVQANDPSPLESQANVRLRDLCDVSPAGCSTLIHQLQYTTASFVLQCDDGSSCTTDYCAEGTCFNVPNCMSNAECDDGSPCITSTCSPDGCCDYIPQCTSDAQCDDGNPCVSSDCVGGCCSFQPACILDAHCDDGHPCTADACTTEGCCVSHLLKSCTCQLGDVSTDFDGNAAVDVVDYQTLYHCLAGPDVETDVECILTDLDCSLTVDLLDFSAIQNSLTED